MSIIWKEASKRALAYRDAFKKARINDLYVVDYALKKWLSGSKPQGDLWLYRGEADPKTGKLLSATIVFAHDYKIHSLARVYSLLDGMGYELSGELLATNLNFTKKSPPSKIKFDIGLEAAFVERFYFTVYDENAAKDVEAIAQKLGNSVSSEIPKTIEALKASENPMPKKDRRKRK